MRQAIIKANIKVQSRSRPGEPIIEDKKPAVIRRRYLRVTPRGVVVLQPLLEGLPLFRNFPQIDEVRKLVLVRGVGAGGYSDAALPGRELLRTEL